MGVKISQMPETTKLNDNDLIMVVQEGENKRISVSNLKKLLNKEEDKK